MRTASTSRTFVRSQATGILFSMLFYYGIHLFGSWDVENYRPDSDTTSTVLLHNKCLLLNTIHTLRPNTPVSTMDDSFDGNKLAGSFMNFFDGHIIGMLLLALLMGTLIFFFWDRKNKSQQVSQVT